MPSQTPKLDFWLEPLDLRKHLQDFHELCSDEKACLWSSQPCTTGLEVSKERLFKALTHNPESKPWHLSCAVMSSDYVRPAPAGSNGSISNTTTETKMIGVVRTTRASTWGLSIGYKLRSDCWGKGYATRAIRAFLELYWSLLRVAPRKELIISEARESGQGEEGGPSASAGDLQMDQGLQPGNGATTSAGDVAVDLGESDGDGDEVEITHLIAQVDPENVGSMRVSEKCGGRLVTVGRECVKVWRFSEMRDMAVWRFDKPSDNVESF
ncbi:hypothetical protein CORC01_01161 [Colletotrichum orchidophilum]|uniref:N-acetyltransferase domain-containing protein n=1 Tax=Colletotrichum orchidophilum TaxID=1209926 RepID=A0A1G4BPP8_9PEZI|nr:uncharacterized protein CORC01_01161 [Colletotrichum orchidophilum]OHF03442.1 hypothetical protein CORC01_01161 [Colletotrichum orchidophilum]